MEASPAISDCVSTTYGEWSTHGRMGRSKIDFWNHLTSEVFTPLSIDPADHDIFEARMAKADVGEAGIAKIWSAGSVVRHSRQHVALSRDNPCFLLHMQVSGSSLNEQGGRTVDLRPGDCTIVDSSRPYSLTFGPNTRFIVWRISAARLREFIPESETLISNRIAGDLPPTRILKQLLNAFSRECKHAADRDWMQQSDSVLLSMLALASRSISPLGRDLADGHALLSRAIDLVNASLCDPEFGAGSLATELGVSERYVQRVFSSRGITPHDFIVRQRIDRAARILKSCDMSITQVAMETGFNDPTQFGRSFRRVMGMTASQFRRGGSS